MEYFRIVNFEKFQHYKKKNKNSVPLWIKLHISILDDYDFNLLSKNCQLLLLKLFLVAAKTGNRMPLDQQWVSRMTQWGRQCATLKPLLASKFIEIIEVSTKNPIREGYKEEDIHKKIKIFCPTPKKSSDFSPKKKEFDFDFVWQKYPSQIGKKAAEKHFRASVKTEQDFSDIQIALENYILFVGSENGRGFNLRFKNGSTWFNNWRDFLNLQVKKILCSPPPRKLTAAEQSLENLRLSREKRIQGEKLLELGNI